LIYFFFVISYLFQIGKFFFKMGCLLRNSVQECLFVPSTDEIWILTKHFAHCVQWKTIVILAITKVLFGIWSNVLNYSINFTITKNLIFGSLSAIFFGLGRIAIRQNLRWKLFISSDFSKSNIFSKIQEIREWKWHDFEKRHSRCFSRSFSGAGGRNADQFTQENLRFASFSKTVSFRLFPFPKISALEHFLNQF